MYEWEIKSNSIRKIIWPLLLLVSSVGIALMWTQTFEFFPREKAPGDRENWKQFLILPFYFTFLSNLCAFLASFFRCTEIIKNENFLRRLEIFMAVNLTITMLVYWTMIFPRNEINSPFSFTATFWIHVITPCLSLIVFFLHNHVYAERVSVKTWRNSIWHLIFPVVWLIVAISIYYILGGNKNDAIYKFLDFNHQAWWMSILVVSGIGIAYYLFTALYTKITNPKEKIDYNK